MDLETLTLRKALTLAGGAVGGLEAGVEGLTGGWVEANKLRRKQSPWPGRVCLELAGVGTRAGTIGGYHSHLEGL